MSYMLYIKQLTAPGGHVNLILADHTKAAHTLRALADKIEAGEVVVASESWFESLSKPDMVGSAEYRAIYELLESVDTDESRDSILDELESQLQDIRKLQQQQ